MKKDWQVLKVNPLALIRKLNRRVECVALHLLCGFLAVLLMATSAVAQTTFTYTGALQTYTVPVGAIGVLISAKGAGGGGAGWDANGSGGDGGAGATASGTYLVAAGTVLNIAVGGGGQGGKSQSTFAAADLGGIAAGGFAGGDGGRAGGAGYSGNGGGGGALSGVLGILLAGGGGGGQGGGWNGLGKFGDSSTATGTLPAAAGAAGLSPGAAADGGGGGGGGAGCPAGAAGPVHTDNTIGTQGGFAGRSCALASVTGLTVSGGGGAGGIGRLATQTNLSGTAGANGSVTITPIFPAASLIITKTDGKAFTSSGGTNSYVVTLTNQGPDAANGVVLTDSPSMGLICPPGNGVTCSVTSGSALCPTGPFTMANLTGAGITVATFPANSSLQFVFTCNVN
jgi:uncharacterized repeat protein (TIGR01451 family)